MKRRLRRGEILEIFDRYWNERASPSKLADDFSVSRQTIQSIVARRTYTDLLSRARPEGETGGESTTSGATA